MSTSSVAYSCLTQADLANTGHAVLAIQEIVQYSHRIFILA